MSNLQTAEISLLHRLVEIYSPSHEEGEVSAFLVASMRNLGFDAYQDAANNAVGILGSGPKTVILLGHIDTVPGRVPVEIREGRLYGRGSVDAKGPMACFVAAAARFRSDIATSDKRIVIIGAVEEEAATSRGAQQAVRDFATPAFCIIGEPSRWNAITMGYKGRLLLDYVQQVPWKHTAAPGKLVCEQAVDYWNAIQAWCEPFNNGKPVFETLDPSIRSFNSENDGISETARLRMGFRLPLGFPAEEFKQFLVAASSGAQLSFSGGEPAVRSSKSNALVRAFLHSIRQYGGDPKFKVKTGTADMNVVAPYWACPMLAYGPGDSSLDHTPDEHIEIDEYARAIDVLESVLRLL